VSRRKNKSPEPARPRDSVTVRPVPGSNAWELVHPRCARARADDIAEVEQMLAAGEDELAMDELRWLLDGCGDFIIAHKLLGELAVAAGDLSLARGHFGYAYQIGERALKAAGNPRPLPYDLPANQPFLEAAKGLAWCLKEQSKAGLARQVIETILACDPTDPLGVRTLLTNAPNK
jgi:hypothetical protein